jgi:dihydrolipoamide dehydrogenase
MKTYDAIVIGAGPGGYPCAIRLGQLKQKVLCVDKEYAGGVCLNWGCVPSKALINAAHQYERSKSGAMGIKVDGVTLDPNALQDWKGGIVTKLTGGVKSLLKMNGADFAIGTGRVLSANTVEVTNAEGQKEVFKADKAVVIATGSQTIEIPTFKFDGKQIIGAREAVSLREIPKRLLVIGGGIIGLELGMVYQKFGSELTVLEALPTILTGVDPDCTKVVERRILKHKGVIHTGAKALGYEKMKDGSLSVAYEKDGKRETVVCDVVLVAVGMRPTAKNLGLEDIGVKLTDRGFVQIDKQGKTNVPGVYALGDVSGPPLLAHKATREGEVVAEVIAGHPAAMDWAAMPGAIFTDPEIATVGLTEAEAKAKGIEVRVGKFPFAALAKAMAIGETDGFVKIVADKNTKQILGVHIVGPEASTMISEAVLSVEMAAFLDDLSLTVHPHPTLGEAMMEAANHALGHAIHIGNR